jgi:hypothetical protein
MTWSAGYSYHSTEEGKSQPAGKQAKFQGYPLLLILFCSLLLLLLLFCLYILRCFLIKTENERALLFPSENERGAQKGP